VKYVIVSSISKVNVKYSAVSIKSRVKYSTVSIIRVKYCIVSVVRVKYSIVRFLFSESMLIGV